MTKELEYTFLYGPLDGGKVGCDYELPMYAYYNYFIIQRNKKQMLSRYVVYENYGSGLKYVTTVKETEPEYDILKTGIILEHAEFE